MLDKLKKLILLVGFLIIAATSIYAAKRPDWILGKSKDYPESKFLTGVGVGSNLDLARSSARAEIAKIFHVAISQVSSQVQKEETKIKGNNPDSVSSQKTEIQTNSSTNDVLEGVSIADTWFDKKNKQYYALAVLEKMKLSAILSSQIAELEQTIQAKLQLVNRDESPVDKIRALSMAIKANTKINELTGKKRIADAASAMPDISDTSVAQLEKMRQEEAQKVIFVVLDESIKEYKLRAVANKTITGLGFKVSTALPKTGENFKNMIIIRCKLDLKPQSRNLKGWKFYSWESTFDMFDGSLNGKLLSSVSPKGDASGLNDETAQEKALNNARTESEVSIKDMISRYFFEEQ
ncbi:MAG: LPP20 family lipoprotein [Elusimicrobia bacterium]|nr:LPP20 family lipoprotein [Candidatus Liberimonas magnetica]